MGKRLLGVTELVVIRPGTDHPADPRKRREKGIAIAVAVVKSTFPYLRTSIPQFLLDFREERSTGFLRRLYESWRD